MKKINRITISHVVDNDHDLSMLGSFSDKPGKYAIEHDGGRNSYRYFNAENVSNTKEARENYEEMMKFERGELYMIGVRAYADIATKDDENFKSWTINRISSAGIWGITQGYKNDTEDIKEIEQEQLAEIKDILASLGFTASEIEGAALVVEDAMEN